LRFLGTTAVQALVMKPFKRFLELHPSLEILFPTSVVVALN